MALGEERKGRKRERLGREREVGEGEGIKTCKALDWLRKIIQMWLGRGEEREDNRRHQLTIHRYQEV